MIRPRELGGIFYALIKFRASEGKAAKNEKKVPNEANFRATESNALLDVPSFIMASSASERSQFREACRLVT